MWSVHVIMWFTLGGCGCFHDCLIQQTIFKSLYSIDMLLYSFVYFYHLHQAVEGIYMYESIIPGP